MAEPKPKFTDEELLDDPEGERRLESSVNRAIASTAFTRYHDGIGFENPIITGTNTIVSPDLIIKAGLVISRDATIGKRCYTETSIGQAVAIGEDVIIHGGGKLGLSSAKNIPKNHYFPDRKRPTTIIIEDNVQLSAGVIVQLLTHIGAQTNIQQKVILGKLPAGFKEKERKTTLIGKRCSIGKGVIVEAGAYIGDDIVIKPGTVIPHYLHLENTEKDFLEIDEKYLRAKGMLLPKPKAK